MAHVSDFTQEEDKIVLDLINEENGTSFSLSELTISNPEIVGGPNVRVTLTPTLGTGYGGNQIVNYRRLSIQSFMDLFYPGGFVIPLGDAVTTLDFLDEVNAGLGTNITSNQVVSVDIGEWEGTPNETKNVNFVIATTSKVYHGVAVITVDGNDIPLSAVVTETVLSGLNLPSQTPPTDLQPLLDAMVYPFEANLNMTPEFVLGELNKYLGVEPGDISFSAGAQFPTLANPERSVGLVSNNPMLVFNGNNASSVQLGLGRFVIPNDQFQSFVTGGNNWTWNATRGWYNDVNQPDNSASNLFSLIGLSSLHSRLKHLGGTFTQYPLQASNGLGSNFLSVFQGVTPIKVGTWDQFNGVATQWVYKDNTETNIAGDVVNQVFRLNLPPPAGRVAITDIKAASAWRSGFNKGIRGMKDIFFEMYVTRAPIKSNRFRILIEKNQSGNYIELKKVNLLDKDEVNQLTVDKLVSSNQSSFYNGLDQYKAIGVVSPYSGNGWCTLGPVPGQWVSFELSEEINVETLQIELTGNVGSSPITFELQTDQGEGWVTRKRIENISNWAAGALSRSFDLK